MDDEAERVQQWSPAKKLRRHSFGLLRIVPAHDRIETGPDGVEREAVDGEELRP
jgi:hypothetical protein